MTYNELHGTGSKFLENAAFVCSNVPATAAMLRDAISGMVYMSQ
jgi:hypothetical protein